MDIVLGLVILLVGTAAASLRNYMMMLEASAY